MTVQTQEKKEFQAEVRQLLQLVIHSLYSNKEIFLRELISNAADACDKLRYLSLQKPEWVSSDHRFVIRIDCDKEKKTIRISDTGIGMSFDEVVSHIGTIARSGTKEFLSQMTGEQAHDTQLIGQFGVGFYSAFVVAKSVSIETRRADLPADQGVLWSSNASEDYTIEKIHKETPGTTVVLFLRDGEEKWMNDWELKQIIKKYADHISWPIEMPTIEWDDEKKEMVQREGWSLANRAETFWLRPKSQIKPEEYQDFYHSLGGVGEFLTHTHNHVEGKVEYTQLLYVPSHPPFDLQDQNRSFGLKLYVQHVFIMEEANQLLPNYLRFVRGVVDSSGLPLNVSREILQESRDVRVIREGATKKVLSLLADLARNEPERYQLFWDQFGPYFKEGIVEDTGNREKIADLLRFSSTQCSGDEKTVRLSDYVSRMKEGQNKIYYLTADSYLSAKNSPHLEVFHDKSIEVLLLYDRIDEYVVHFLTEFSGHPLQSVAKGESELDDMIKEEKETIDEQEKEKMMPLLDALKKSLNNKVKDVRVSTRLTSSPACLVADQNDMSGNLERLLKTMGQNVPVSKPILEINPHHAMLKRLEATDSFFDDWAMLLFEQALLAEGGKLEDPATFVKRVNTLILSVLH